MERIRDDSLSLTDAEYQYGVSRDTLRRACCEGRLPGFKRGSRWRVNRDALEEWLEGFATKPRLCTKPISLDKSQEL